MRAAPPPGMSGAEGTSSPPPPPLPPPPRSMRAAPPPGMSGAVRSDRKHSFFLSVRSGPPVPAQLFFFPHTFLCGATAMRPTLVVSVAASARGRRPSAFAARVKRAGIARGGRGGGGSTRDGPPPPAPRPHRAVIAADPAAAACLQVPQSAAASILPTVMISEGERAGRGGRAGAEIGGKARAQDPHVFRGTPGRRRFRRLSSPSDTPSARDAKIGRKLGTTTGNWAWAGTRPLNWAPAVPFPSPFPHRHPPQPPSPMRAVLAPPAERRPALAPTTTTAMAGGGKLAGLLEVGGSARARSPRALHLPGTSSSDSAARRRSPRLPRRVRGGRLAGGGAAPRCSGSGTAGWERGWSPALQRTPRSATFPVPPPRTRSGTPSR